MANFCIMRIKKLHTNANVGGAISHHLRTRETDNADPERIKKDWFYPNNYTKDENGKIDYAAKNTDFEERKKLQQATMARYKKLLPEKVRKNGVRAVEFMMTVSPEVMQRKDFNSVKYLNACGNWAREKFGKENVFFIAQHYDETTPHVSILLTPKDENGKLNARKFFGGREKMQELQDDFFEKVGKEFGLERGLRGSKAKHQDIQKYYQKLNERTEEIDDIKTAVALRMPKKKILQSDEEYKAEVVNIVQGELDTLKPLLKESIDIGTKKEQLRKEESQLQKDKIAFQTSKTSQEKDLARREQNINKEVQDGINSEVQKIQSEFKTQYDNEVSKLQGEFTKAYEDAYVPKSMKFKKGDKTIDFNKMTYSQLAEELASFYLDDEPTVHKRKREIEREFEQNKVHTQGY